MSKHRTGRERRGFTIQLSPSNDQGLIDWLDEIPDGERSAVIKGALYREMGRPRPIPVAELPAHIRRASNETVAAVNASLLDMHADLTRRMGEVGNGTNGGVDNGVLAAVAAGLKQLDRRITELAVNGSIMTSVPVSIPASNEVDATPRLSATEIESRKANIKKSAKW